MAAKIPVFTVALALLLVTMAANGVSSGKTTGALSLVEFRHSGISSMGGKVAGACELHGLELDHRHPMSVKPGPGSSLTLRRTWANYSVISPQSNPLIIPQQASQTVQTWVLVGEVEIAKYELGVIVIEDGDDARLDWRASNSSSGRPAWQAPSPAEFTYEADAGGKATIRQAIVSGPFRTVTFDSLAAVGGNFSLLVRNATVRFSDQTLVTGEYRSTRPAVANPLVEQWQVTYVEAILRLRDARSHEVPVRNAYCGSMDIEFSGGLTMTGARGTARGDEEIRFENQTVGLTGSGRLVEKPQANTPRSESPAYVGQAAGHFTSLKIDHSAAWLPLKPPQSRSMAAIGFGAFALLVLAWTVKNLGTLVGIFYSRHSRDQVLKHASRNLIYASIQQNPGLDMTRVREVVPFHLTTILYHVQVMRRVGLVRILADGRSRRIFPIEQAGVPPMLTRKDFVANRLSAGPVFLGTLVAELADRFKITRRGAYMFIHRLAAAGQVKRIGSRKREMVERIDS